MNGIPGNFVSFLVESLDSRKGRVGERETAYLSHFPCRVILIAELLFCSVLVVYGMIDKIAVSLFPAILFSFYLRMNRHLRVFWFLFTFLLEYNSLERESIMILMILDMFSRKTYIDFFTQSSAVTYFPVFFVNHFTLYSFSRELLLIDSCLCILLFLLVCILIKYNEFVWKVNGSYSNSLVDYKNILERSGMKVLIIDPEGIILYENNTNNSLFPEKSIGRAFFTVFSPEVQPQIRSFFSALQNTHAAEEIVTQFEDPAFQLKLSGKSTVYRKWPCFQITITSLDSILQQIRVTRKLHERFQLKNEEISTIFSFLYKYNEGISQQELEMLRSHCNDLRNIMYFEEILGGALKVTFSPFNLTKELCSAIDGAWLDAQRKRLSVFLSNECAHKLIYSDRLKLVGIFNTTLNFAVKHADNRSSIRVSCKRLYDFRQELEFKFKFKSRVLTEETLCMLYSYRSREKARRSMENMVFIIDKYGIDIALVNYLLEALDGYVSKVKVEGNTVVAYRVEYIPAVKKPKYQSQSQVVSRMFQHIQHFKWEQITKSNTKKFPASLHALQKKAKEFTSSHGVRRFSTRLKDKNGAISEAAIPKIWLSDQEEDCNVDEGSHNVSVHIDIQRSNLKEISSDSFSSQDVDNAVVVISTTLNFMKNLVHEIIGITGNFPFQFEDLQGLLDSFSDVMKYSRKGVILLLETTTNLSLLPEVIERVQSLTIRVIGISLQNESTKKPFESICKFYLDHHEDISSIIRDIEATVEP